jgi:hypothetical protein
MRGCSTRYARRHPAVSSIALIFAIVVASLAFTACGGSTQDDTGSAGATSPFAGTWKIDGGGFSLDPEYAGYAIGIPGEGGTVTVSGDGKAVTMTGSNDVTWQMVAPTVDGEYLIFAAGTGSDADEWALHQTGGTTTLTKRDSPSDTWDDGYPLVKAN